MLNRWVRSKILAAMEIFDVTIVMGPRQAGKSILCQQIAIEKSMPYLSLDNLSILNYLTADPNQFFTFYPKAVIDEIQRAPHAILALKYAVDQARQPGRYIITGSVDMWNSGIAPDSLAGRAQIVKLYPLSRAEITNQTPSRLIEEAFNRSIPLHEPDTASLASKDQLAAWIMKGGYPAPLNYDQQLSHKWIFHHLNLVAYHDMQFLQKQRRPELFMRFLTYIALHSGKSMNMSACGSVLGLAVGTIQRWLELAEHLFLIKRLPPWHSHLKKQLAKAPKYYFIDTAILTALHNYNPGVLLKEQNSYGAFLETYVFSEIVKIIAAMDQSISMYHYREHNKHEVDFVLSYQHQVVGIEVKSAHNIYPKDLNGLTRLAQACGENFMCGIILYNGSRVQKIKEHFYVLPLQRLLYPS